MSRRRIMRKTTRQSALLSLGIWLLGSSAHAMPAAEEAKAQALLVRVQVMQGAVFIRNGTEYGSANAAEFLRRKCTKDWSKMASAREFITACASQSSTSGKPYLIRLAGATPQPSAQVLTQWLEEIERTGK
jgi:hypothetical protein